MSTLIPADQGLTQMELVVLHWVAEGKSIRDTAAILGCCDQTVKNHRNRIFKKLDCVNSAHLVAVAYARGLLKVALE